MTIIIISTGFGGLLIGSISVLFAIKYWQNIRLFVADVTHFLGFLGKRVRKFSIVNELEGSINNISEEINRIMPEPLLPKCKIKWVVPNDEKGTLVANEAIVCLSFDKYDHDRNFYNALQTFVKTGLLHKAKPFLAQNTSKAIDFLTVKSILKGNRPRILGKFNEHFSQQDESFKEKYSIVEAIDDNGFFENVLLTEVNLFGEKVFTKTPDKKIENEVEGFIDWLHRLATRERGEMSILSFDNNNIKVGIMLVADNQIYDQYGAEAYFRRAYSYASKGYPCIYLFAIGKQKNLLCHQIADELIESEHFEKINKQSDIIRYDEDGLGHTVTCICLKINADVIKFDFWNQIKQAKDEGQTIKAEIEVVEDNKLQVNYLGRKGIVSRNELSRITITDIYSYFRPHDVLSLRIIELNEAKDSVVFSNKSTNTDPADNIEKNLDSRLNFTVEDIAINKMGNEAGLIVYNEEKDIHGFVPRSMATFGRFTKLSQKYHIKQKLEVQIQKYAPERNTYICKICDLEDPWTKMPSEAIAFDGIVKGEIAEIGYSYITCSLAEGIEGRIAIADLSWESADTNRNRLKNYTIGQIIEAKVIEIDIGNRVVCLSVKDLCKNPAIEFFEKHKNICIKGTVEKITPTGLFISLSSNINGFVPKSEVSWFYMKDLSSRHNLGETVDINVVAYDSQHENVICSIRATQQNDFDKISSCLTQGDVVKGKVLKYLEDKAEVQIEVDGLYGYGFVHKSQISHVLFISDDIGPKILKPNHNYQFVISAINTNFKTFALSRKAYYERTIDDIIYGNEYTVNVIPTPSLTYVYNNTLEGILIGDSPKSPLPAIVIPAKIDKNKNRIEMTISNPRSLYS